MQNFRISKLRMLNFDFIGCGALNWDIFFEVEEFLSLKFENLKILAGREVILEREQFLRFLKFLEKEGNFLFECGGGSSANTIYALSCWGFKSAFIGAVGEDEVGRKIVDELEGVGINTEFIVKGGETSLAIILLDKRKDRFIAVSPGDSEVYLSQSKVKLYGHNTLFHFSSFASKTGQKFQKDLLSKIDTKISFDPGEIYAGLGKEFLISFFEKTGILFITEYELKKIGVSIEELFNLGVEKIFLKKGKEGAECFTKQQKIEMPAFKVGNIVDNTGAGDYFNAGVLAGLKMEFPEEKALKLGIYSAGMSLRDYGRKGCLTKEEFQNYVNLLK